MGWQWVLVSCCSGTDVKKGKEMRYDKVGGVSRVCSFVLFAMFSAVACGATTIAIESVTQRWPWNNKIDIKYVVTGGQDVSKSDFQKVVFTTVIGGTTYTIDGSTVGASASEGTHTVSWTVPAKVKCMDCSISAAVYSADVPSGKDYMIIDLDTGAVTYEGLYSSQALSDARYNGGDTYKKDKMVLRRVPAGGTYPSGDDVNYPNNNPAKTWTTDRDFYAGVFLVTQYQYEKLTGTNPSSFKSDADGNPAAVRPVENVSWTDLRGDAEPTEALAPDASGTFLQRLNHKTLTACGVKGFDLPTELMYEISARAGATTVYWWGDTADSKYAVCKENSGEKTWGVGSKAANAWGLYDMAGNVFAHCLDDDSLGNQANAASPFVPAWGGTSDQRRSRGNSWRASVSESAYRASSRSKGLLTSRYYATGFRVFLIAD